MALVLVVMTVLGVLFHDQEQKRWDKQNIMLQKVKTQVKDVRADVKEVKQAIPEIVSSNAEPQ